jgi:hypothetical protein
MFFHQAPHRDERVVAAGRRRDVDELLVDGCVVVLLWLVVLLLVAVGATADVAALVVAVSLL